MARSLELKVGVMILAATAILLAFIFVLGNFSLRDGFHIAVDFDYVGSLQPGAPVKVSGIKVGNIEDVRFWGGKLDPHLNERVQVRVDVWIEERARDSIRTDAEFFINTTGMSTTR
jgi:phospholipid/cholesterol/gamma-HCH transport system substrate-binding protein